MQEIWKDIKGYENRYQVSNLGKIRRKNYDYRSPKYRILKPKIEKNGYYRITLSFNNCSKTYGIHRLVAQAFIPNPNNYPIINHKDENPSNNYVENLEWCTYSYNSSYGSARYRKFKKAIIQCDLEGNVIRKWDSAHEVERTLGIPHQQINSNLKLRQPTCHGYIWKYANE